jgi:hypothetical protein
MRQHYLLVAQRDGAELFCVLVVFGDRIDEGTAVETLLAEPALQRRKDPRQLGLRIAAAGLDGADEPFAPRLAFAAKRSVGALSARFGLAHLMQQIVTALAKGSSPPHVIEADPAQTIAR